MPKTYTKKIVKWMLIIGSINGTVPFVLAAFGRDPVAELGIAWITEIVAVIVGYLLKSFQENKQKAKQRHDDLVAGIPDSDNFILTDVPEENIEEGIEEDQP